MQSPPIHASCHYRHGETILHAVNTQLVDSLSTVFLATNKPEPGQVRQNSREDGGKIRRQILARLWSPSSTLHNRPGRALGYTDADKRLQYSWYKKGAP